MGNFPIRDTTLPPYYSMPLPYFAKNLAANAQFPGFLASHDTFGGCQDRDTHSGKHPRDFFLMRIYSPSRPADALQTCNDWPFGASLTNIFQADTQHVFRWRAAFSGFKIFNETFLFHYA